MYRHLFGWLIAIVIYPSCSSNSPDISVVCEENPKGRGNCVIKWETTPVLNGKVKIYASTDPNNIPEDHPVTTTNISDQRATIVISDPTQRYYYKMVFNNRYRVVTASRNSVIPGIQNFRDIGGYSAAKRKQIRWGMLYRSAQIETVSYATIKELNNIGIKTIIDLRSESEVARSPKLSEKGFNVVHIPIGAVNMKEMMQDLRRGKISNDSIYRFMLRMNKDLVTYYRPEYKRMFDVLEDEKNYPALIVCTSGMGRTAIASALVLSALGVDDDTIISDYLRGNDFYDIPQSSRFGYKLPVNAQEAITTLHSARTEFLNTAKKQIEKTYGNVPTYLDKGIGLSNDDIKHLRSILLH